MLQVRQKRPADDGNAITFSDTRRLCQRLRTVTAAMRLLVDAPPTPAPKPRGSPSSSLEDKAPADDADGEGGKYHTAAELLHGIRANVLQSWGMAAQLEGVSNVALVASRKDIMAADITFTYVPHNHRHQHMGIGSRRARSSGHRSGRIHTTTSVVMVVAYNPFSPSHSIEELEEVVHAVVGSHMQLQRDGGGGRVQIAATEVQSFFTSSEWLKGIIASVEVDDDVDSSALSAVGLTEGSPSNRTCGGKRDRDCRSVADNEAHTDPTSSSSSSFLTTVRAARLEQLTERLQLLARRVEHSRARLIDALLAVYYGGLFVGDGAPYTLVASDRDAELGRYLSHEPLGSLVAEYPIIVVEMPKRDHPGWAADEVSVDPSRSPSPILLPSRQGTGTSPLVVDDSAGGFTSDHPPAEVSHGDGAGKDTFPEDEPTTVSGYLYTALAPSETNPTDSFVALLRDCVLTLSVRIGEMSGGQTRQHACKRNQTENGASSNAAPPQRSLVQTRVDTSIRTDGGCDHTEPCLGGLVLSFVSDQLPKSLGGGVTEPTSSARSSASRRSPRLHASSLAPSPLVGPSSSLNSTMTSTVHHPTLWATLTTDQCSCTSGSGRPHASPFSDDDEEEDADSDLNAHTNGRRTASRKGQPILLLDKTFGRGSSLERTLGEGMGVAGEVGDAPPTAGRTASELSMIQPLALPSSNTPSTFTHADTDEEDDDDAVALMHREPTSYHPVTPLTRRHIHPLLVEARGGGFDGNSASADGSRRATPRITYYPTTTALPGSVDDNGSKQPQPPHSYTPAADVGFAVALEERLAFLAAARRVGVAMGTVASDLAEVRPFSRPPWEVPAAIDDDKDAEEEGNAVSGSGNGLKSPVRSSCLPPLSPTNGTHYILSVPLYWLSWRIGTVVITIPRRHAPRHRLGAKGHHPYHAMLKRLQRWRLLNLRLTWTLTEAADYDGFGWGYGGGSSSDPLTGLGISLGGGAGYDNVDGDESTSSNSREGLKALHRIGKAIGGVLSHRHRFTFATNPDGQLRYLTTGAVANSCMGSTDTSSSSGGRPTFPILTAPTSAFVPMLGAFKGFSLLIDMDRTLVDNSVALVESLLGGGVGHKGGKGVTTATISYSTEAGPLGSHPVDSTAVPHRREVVVLRPGVIRFLRTLKAYGVGMMLVSKSRRRRLRAIVEGLIDPTGELFPLPPLATTVAAHGGGGLATCGPYAMASEDIKVQAGTASYAVKRISRVATYRSWEVRRWEASHHDDGIAPPSRDDDAPPVSPPPTLLDPSKCFILDDNPSDWHEDDHNRLVYIPAFTYGGQWTGSVEDEEAYWDPTSGPLVGELLGRALRMMLSAEVLKAAAREDDGDHMRNSCGAPADGVDASLDESATYDDTPTAPEPFSVITAPAMFTEPSADAQPTVIEEEGYNNTGGGGVGYGYVSPAAVVEEPDDSSHDSSHNSSTIGTAYAETVNAMPNDTVIILDENGSYVTPIPPSGTAVGDAATVVAQTFSRWGPTIIEDVEPM